MLNIHIGENKMILGNKTLEELIKNFYFNEKNYYIEINEHLNNNICVVYFSSNGIYADTEKDFESVIVQKNRFEWKNTRIKNAKKSIFLRDINKNFYVDGINSRINSIDKVIDFLRNETSGYDIVTVGSSAGGYMAITVGVLLGAKRVYSFCGILSLRLLYGQNTFCRYKKGNQEIINYLKGKNQYYDFITTHMKESNVLIFHINSQMKMDIDQAYLTKGHFNIFSFDMKNRNHRYPVCLFNFRDIINYDSDKLRDLSMKYCDKKISNLRLSIELIGYVKTLYNYVKMFFKKNTIYSGY